MVSPACGMFMGNRGLLHNAKRELPGKQWSPWAWIICALCRPKELKVFKAAWLKGNEPFGLNGNPGIVKIDAILHQERVSTNGRKVTFETTAGDLTNGVFLMRPQIPCAIRFFWTGFPVLSGQ